MDFDRSNVKLSSLSSAVYQSTAISEPAAPGETPFHRMAQSVESARNLAARAEMIADQLCGGVPQAVGNTTGIPTGGGLFSSLSNGAEELAGYVSRAESALSRIQSHLP